MDKTVLAYIDNGNEYLMLYRNKKKNDYNHGKWIGVGGHIEDGEAPDQALIREIKEETGLDVLSYKLVGEIEFIDTDFNELMYLYIVDNYSGNLIECDEGDLKWIPKNEILKLNLYEGDKLFLERLLNNDYNKFDLRLTYEKGKFIGGKFR
ncbi:MAG: 8-oxo-dGTP diphosphatase [Acholeplasmatales bacterium]|nr:8-oxo-dGTP diphosphatase [Acholeplasmatales bacterium]